MPAICSHQILLHPLVKGNLNQALLEQAKCIHSSCCTCEYVLFWSDASLGLPCVPRHRVLKLGSSTLVTLEHTARLLLRKNQEQCLANACMLETHSLCPLVCVKNPCHLVMLPNHRSVPMLVETTIQGETSHKQPTTVHRQHNLLPACCQMFGQNVTLICGTLEQKGCCCQLQMQQELVIGPPWMVLEPQDSLHSSKHRCLGVSITCSCFLLAVHDSASPAYGSPLSCFEYLSHSRCPLFTAREIMLANCSDVEVTWSLEQNNGYRYKAQVDGMDGQDLCVGKKGPSRLLLRSCKTPKPGWKQIDVLNAVPCSATDTRCAGSESITGCIVDQDEEDGNIGNSKCLLVEQLLSVSQFSIFSVARATS